MCREVKHKYNLGSFVRKESIPERVSAFQAEDIFDAEPAVTEDAEAPQA